MDYIVWKITETEEELRASLKHPEYYAEKVENLKPGSRRMLEVLAVRRAVKELFYGVEQRIGYDAEGRPSLVCRDDGTASEGAQPALSEGVQPMQISISHTHGYAAVIVDEKPVGIDIEQRGRRVQKVTSHFLRHEEMGVLALSADLDLALHLAWSAKETAYKVLGRAYYDLQNLTTVTHIDWENRCLILEVKGRDEAMLISFDYTDDYVLTYTVEKSS